MGDHWKQVWLYICIKISVLYFSYITWVTIENKFDCTFVFDIGKIQYTDRNTNIESNLFSMVTREI
jgi:hypothetical protein